MNIGLTDIPPPHQCMAIATNMDRGEVWVCAERSRRRSQFTPFCWALVDRGRRRAATHPPEIGLERLLQEGTEWIFLPPFPHDGVRKQEGLRGKRFTQTGRRLEEKTRAGGAELPAGPSSQLGDFLALV